MPLVQKTLTLAAGATSDNILANTNYEFVDGNVRLRVASAVDTAGTSATADTFLNVSVNNAEYSKDVSVPALVTGQPFGVLNGSYTNKLLSEKSLSKAKVIEEISELIDAVEKDTNKVHEAADVFYHLIMYLEANNIKIEDVMLELDKRKKWFMMKIIFLRKF